jgi:alkanesulfonate monooxygenase SsuD/methylene tetrahydromethanopterin reductase-like flavin-dependent oxidoreductase (luciferase family)
MLHEALVSMFHARPLLAARLLEAPGMELPAHSAVVLADATFSQIAPAEYRADAVVVLGADRPVLAIIVEVQLGVDDAKTYTWPVYGATLRARMRCPVTVLIVTPDRTVAAWAARPIELGPNSMFAVSVVGPDVVPRVDTVEEAQRCPELAVLSVLSHAREAGAEALAAVAIHAAKALDEERSTLYCDLVLSALGPAARACLEELMKTKYEYQSDFATKYYSQGREEGLREFFRRQLKRVGVVLDRRTAERLDAAGAEVLERIAENVVLAGDPDAVAESIRQHLDSAT